MLSHHRHSLPMLIGIVFFLSVALALPGLPAQESPFRAAADYSKSVDGFALLIYRDGKLVFEEYHNGYKATKPHHIFSGTKSFAPAIALIAQGEGLLKLDEPVADTIKEWHGDKQKEKITIRHLLTFTSGLKNIDRDLHRGRSRDKYAAGVACPMATEPGARFRYGSNHLMVFGELMKRKLAQAKGGRNPEKDVFDYLQTKVFQPIGLKTGFWLRDGAGNPLLPYGAFITAREWAKYGLLILHQGRHGKRQVLPSEYFKESFVGTKANPGYGLNWWLIGKFSRKFPLRKSLIPQDTVAAQGMYNQKLYVIPSRKMVIVRFGRSPSRKKFDNRQFFNLLYKPPTGKPKEKGTPAKGKKRRRII